jgi:hypothetical protein
MRTLFTTPNHDTPLTELIDRLELCESVVRRILLQSSPTVDQIAYAVCLLHLSRALIPTLLARFAREYETIRFKRSPYVVTRGTGGSVRDRVSGDMMANPNREDQSRLVECQLTEIRYDRAVVQLEQLSNQLKQLASQSFDQFKAVKPSKRLIGDGDLWSIVLCWLNRGSVKDTLPDGNSFLGWADNSINHSEQLRTTLQSIVQPLKRQRLAGIRQPKGSPIPSVAQFDRLWSKGLHYRSTRYSAGSIVRRIDVGYGWLRSNGIIDNTLRTNKIMVTGAYRAWIDHGIRQPVINRWADRHGLELSRVYPSIVWTGQPVARDTDRGLVYCASCNWDGNPGTTRGFLVWFANERSEGYHIQPQWPTVDQAIVESLDMLAKRAEVNRRAAEEERIRQLSIRSKRAYLVKQCRSIDQFQLADSYSVGNCKPGTSAFCSRLGIGDRDTIPGIELANRWRKSGYCEQSYFERVILGKGSKVS